MTNDEVSKQLYQDARTHIPPASALAEDAMKSVLGDRVNDKEYIKKSFSALVSEIQVRAYRLYQEHEARASGQAFRSVIRPLLAAQASADDLLEFLEQRFPILDRFFLSLTQSRRQRAGKTFEIVVTTLFQVLEYPHTSQPNLGDSTPDYVLPSIEWYSKYATDCIILTCKRTLRERWRQVVTEGVTGKFYLATIDDGLSTAELGRMRDRRVVVVVPAELKQREYEGDLNVISFETFFEQHLDAELIRWRANGAF